jgi:hypothetical protein
VDSEEDLWVINERFSSGLILGCEGITDRFVLWESKIIGEVTAYIFDEINIEKTSCYCITAYLIGYPKVDVSVQPLISTLKYFQIMFRIRETVSLTVTYLWNTLTTLGILSCRCGLGWLRNFAIRNFAEMSQMNRAKFCEKYHKSS